MSTISNTRLIISILQQIPRDPGYISVSDLREKLLKTEDIDIPVRNMQRYLCQVKGHFGLDCKDAESGNAKMWFIENVERRSENRGLMPTLQAVNYIMAQKLLEGVAPKPILKSMEAMFQQAHVSLSSGEGASLDWDSKIKVIQDGLPTIKKSVTQEIIDTALECLLCETQVEIIYQPAKNVQAKKYTVSPLGMVLKGARQYLVCIDELSGTETPKHFLFNHILECENTHKDIDRSRFIGQRAINLEQYCKKTDLDSFTNQETITLIAEVKAGAWATLENSPISEDQKLEARTDGDTEHKILSAKVANSAELKHWLIGHAKDLTVLEPLKLRNQVHEALADAADRYQALKDEELKKYG